MSQASVTLPALTVTLNSSVDLFAKQVRSELKPVRSEFGQIVSVPHEFRLLGNGWALTIPQTRFSSVDFDNGFVRGVQVNPHFEYLTLPDAARRLTELDETLARSGFRADPERTLTAPQLIERASEIASDSSYNSEVYRAHRGDAVSSLVLKKGVQKGSPLGQVARIDSDLFMLTLTVRVLTPAR